MSKVLVNNLNIRAEPSVNSNALDKYNTGDIIQSGDLIIINEGRHWLRYTGSSGNKRYVCAIDSNGSKYVEINKNLPVENRDNRSQNNNTPQTGGVTGIQGFPKQSNFPNDNIRKWGCCFLGACVKGGLTDMNSCLDCYNWALKNGKIRSDCWVNMDKNKLAQEISQRYGTPFHNDYCFQTNSNRSHFWLTQGGKEVFNSAGIGHH